MPTDSALRLRRHGARPKGWSSPRYPAHRRLASPPSTCTVWGLGQDSRRRPRVLEWHRQRGRGSQTSHSVLPDICLKRSWPLLAQLALWWEMLPGAEGHVPSGLLAASQHRQCPEVLQGTRGGGHMCATLHRLAGRDQHRAAGARGPQGGVTPEGSAWPGLQAAAMTVPHTDLF